MKNKGLLIGFGLLVIIVLYYTFSGSGPAPGGLSATVDPTKYRQEVTDSRAKKNDFFRTSPDSPITNKTAFRPLSYFAPDPAYRVVARLEPFADKTQKLVVRMSDGSEEVYDKFAHAVFSLNGQTARLLVVRVGETYSILFRDATTGKETYGGGRYVELVPAQMTETSAILDFNTAYNPYCAYNPGYACPLPPKENTLPFAINAGERYEAHD